MKRPECVLVYSEERATIKDDLKEYRTIITEFLLRRVSSFM